MTNQALEQVEDVSIGAPEGKAKDSKLPGPAVVYFDSNCPLCRSLASFMAARVDSETMLFTGNPEQSSDTLMVEFEATSGDKQVLVGSEAWAWILNSHPALQELNWLAQKLGIARGTTSALMTAGGLLRRLCIRCGW